MRTFKIYSLSNFQMCGTVLLTILTQLLANGILLGFFQPLTALLQMTENFFFL